MTSITRDPLLAVAKGLLLFLMGVMILAGVACLAAIPVVIFGRADIIVHLPSLKPHADANDFAGALIVLLALGAVMTGLVWKVLQLLKRIVDTVGEGDPFVPVNADRLTAMAWLTLAIQALSLPLLGIGIWLVENLDTSGMDADASGGISGNGLLLVLVLFVLARVFRQGAAMRAELEGTV